MRPRARNISYGAGIKALTLVTCGGDIASAARGWRRSEEVPIGVASSIIIRGAEAELTPRGGGIVRSSGVVRIRRV